MRILFTTTPYATHFQPLIPIARAAADAGHEVAVATPPCLCALVAAAGFRAIPAGYDDPGAGGAEPPNPDLREKPPGLAARPWNHALGWRGMPAERMATDLLPIVRQWQPSIVVREPMEFGGPIIAEHLDLPHAVAGALWFLTDDFEASITRIGGRLPALRRAYMLPPEPDAAMAYRYLTLAAMPRDWPAPDEPVPATTHFIRPDPYASADEALPPGLDALPEQPTIHATLGTVFNKTPGLYAAIIAALRDEPVNLIVAVGRDQDPAAFGPQPPHVRIVRFVPHAALLPHCALIVTHGGYGTLMATLRHGLPAVVLPIMGDQPRNAQRIADLGAGAVVGPEHRTAEAIRAIVREVLDTPTYRRNAERLRDEMAALPGSAQAVQLLERLAAEKRPLLTP